MSEIFTEAFILGLLGTTVRAATPLILAAIGESFSQLSGVINVGLEGYLLMGAFFGYLGLALHRQRLARGSRRDRRAAG